MKTFVVIWLNLKKIALNFVERVWDRGDVLEVVLFGSVARGRVKKESDIDLFVVLKDLEKAEEVEEIARDLDPRLEITVAKPDFSSFDESFISDVYGEGITVFSRKNQLEIEGLELEPKAIVSFSLENLEQREKVKVNRALYGRKTRSEYKGKEYVSEKEGLVPKGGKLGRGAVLIDKSTFKKLREVFERFGVTYKKYDVWI